MTNEQDTPVQALQPADSRRQRDVISRLHVEIESLREMLEVNESKAAEQSRRAELAMEHERQSAAAREEQSRLLRDLIQVSPDAVVLLDENYRITYTNPQARRGMSDGDEVVGKHLTEVFQHIERTPFWECFQRVMQKRVPVSFEEYYEPHEVWYSVNAAPVGKGIAFFFRDVTERRRREASLQRTEKLAAVGRMASSISHEINNPLESVTNLLYLIENAADSSDQTRTYAQLAASELARVSHIVTQTLKFHRQSTQAVFTRASELFESVLSLYRSKLVTLHTELHTRFGPDDSVLCFAGDIRQVLANLVGNALDATGEKGRLWLRTRRARCPRSGISGVRLTVADNGTGMTEATQRSIFEAFFTTKGLTGSGLGMWVSDEIVRAHGGTIRLRSTVEPNRHGTVFSVFLPDRKAAAS